MERSIISMGALSPDSCHHTYRGASSALDIRHDARAFFYDMCLPSMLERIRLTNIPGYWREQLGALEDPRNLHRFNEEINLRRLHWLLHQMRDMDVLYEEEVALQHLGETWAGAMDRALLSDDDYLRGMMEWALLDPGAHARLVFALYDRVLFGAAPHAYTEEQEAENPDLPPSLRRGGQGPGFASALDRYTFVDVAYAHLERFLTEVWMPYVCQHEGVRMAIAELLDAQFDPERHSPLAHALGIFPRAAKRWPAIFPPRPRGC